MSRFLFTIWPYPGHLHPAIAIARAVRARGHEVAFYTGASARRMIEGEGFSLFPFRKLDEQRVTDIVTREFPYIPSLLARVKNSRRTGAKFREWLLDTVPQQVDDITEVLAVWSPDVLVPDMAFWGPILVLHEARPIPVAVLSVAIACALPGPEVPVWGFGWPPPRNAMMRFRYRLSRSLGKRLAAAFREQTNLVRSPYGLPPLSCSPTEHAGRMPLYLMPSIREYDYNRQDLAANVHYVGPCLWDNPEKQPPPPWLNQLPPDQPLIYVTDATIGTSEPFLLKAAALAFQNQRVQVVMTTGKQRNPADLGLCDLPRNIRVEAYVPQSDLLPKTSVMVTVGGSGGVLAALKDGVPLVVSPTEWDRQENAQRVVEAGAGIRIPAERCTPQRLRAAVEQVLRTPSYRNNARRLAAACARYPGPSQAAELLEKLACTATGERNLQKGVALA